jgi:hypothetical protein
MTTSQPAPPDIALIIEWTLDAHRSWDPDHLYRAVSAARLATWPDVKIAGHLVRMAFDPAATPWDLSAAAREPQGTAACVPAAPEVIAQRMAEMRSALPQRRAS